MDTRALTAKRTADARIAAGVTLEDLAATSGIPYASLWRKLKGQSPYTLDEIAALGRALKVRPITLVEFEDAV